MSNVSLFNSRDDLERFINNDLSSQESQLAIYFYDAICPACDDIVIGPLSPPRPRPKLIPLMAFDLGVDKIQSLLGRFRGLGITSENMLSIADNFRKESAHDISLSIYNTVIKNESTSYKKSSNRNISLSLIGKGRSYQDLGQIDLADINYSLALRIK